MNDIVLKASTTIVGGTQASLRQGMGSHQKAWPTPYSECLQRRMPGRGHQEEGGVGHCVNHTLGLPPQGPTAIRTECQRFHGPMCLCDGVCDGVGDPYAAEAI